MNKETVKKLEMFVLVCLLLVGALTFFSYPGITGHVSSDLSTQKVDFKIDQSQLFELTTNSLGSFYITSFRISGSIVGEGVVEVYLDNGKGQQLLVFNNIRNIETGMGGLTGITAKVVGSDQTFNEIIPQKTILIKPTTFINQNPSIELLADEKTINEGFDAECDESCFIEMEMNNDLGYSLIFLIEPGTELYLTKIQYMIKEE